MIGKLGDDLLTEILIRFPNPTSACRNKAVCKQWRSLISDPSFRLRFISHHQSKNKQPPPKLLLSAESLSFFPMPADNRPWDFAVLDCFKDLLLCGFGESGRCTNAELVRSYLLCNLFTEQWIALPLAPERPMGHSALYARLVCEPLVSSDHDIGAGYMYRFRVVCIYRDRGNMKLDMFCSESGEWTKEAFLLEGYCIGGLYDVVSCNGVLYVPRPHGLYRPSIASFNAFRLDIAVTPIDVPPIAAELWWNISVSQGALHLTGIEERAKSAGLLFHLSVWRLDENCKTWSKVCEGPVKSSSVGNCGWGLLVPTLHPEKPEVAFFTDFCGVAGNCHLSCDLRKGGVLGSVSELTQFFTGWRVFQPRVHCWPTPIPRYEKLRVIYDGSYAGWVQSNDPSKAMTPLS
ncbi:unnamed protein product [Linum tenue]|uniref:F-box domain-containing protein n=1 Tax=Linum tenue TaxID=586396 RepID=A0AAV0L8F3_9ROSI|nr:unnamed protein product [Linum tenue]